MAQGKSQKLRILAAHVAVHFAVFLFGGMLLSNLAPALFILPKQAWIVMSVLNASAHALIDWNLWRSYKRIRAGAGEGFQFQNDWLFWKALGLDQRLHGLSIIAAIWAALTF